MEQPTSAPSIKTDFLFLGARFFERVAYYGFRGAVLSFLVNQQLSKDSYGNLHVLFFIYGSIILHIIGGALGDFVFGSKRATIIGGIVFAMGLMLGCIPFTGIIYLSFGLIVLGEGLFTPNFYAFFGKNYLNHQRKIDSRITAISIAKNIGAFSAPLLITFLGDFFNNTLAFVLIGLALCIGLATYFIYLIPSTIEVNSTLAMVNETKTISTTTKYPIYIFTSLLLIYFCIYFFSDIVTGIGTIERQNSFGQLGLFGNNSTLFMRIFDLVIGVVIGVLFVFIWNKHYSSSVKKLFISTLIMLFVFLTTKILFYSSIHFSLILSIGFGILIGLIEVFRYPVFYALLFQNINPKYFGTAVGIGKLLIMLFTITIPGFLLTGKDMAKLNLELIGILATSLCAIVLFFIIRRNQLTQKKSS